MDLRRRFLREVRLPGVARLQRVLRLAINRMAEKGEWNVDELKLEFEELILTDAPLEVSGCWCLIGA